MKRRASFIVKSGKILRAPLAFLYPLLLCCTSIPGKCIDEDLGKHVLKVEKQKDTVNISFCCCYPVGGNVVGSPEPLGRSRGNGPGAVWGGGRGSRLGVTWFSSPSEMISLTSSSPQQFEVLT